MWLSLFALFTAYALMSAFSKHLMYDFFGYIGSAERLPDAGWVHPVHPVGYRLLLRGFYELTGDYAVAGKIIGLAVAALALYYTRRIATLISDSEMIGIAVMLFTGINRHFFHWTTTPSTDLPALAFALGGMYMLLRSELNQEQRRDRVLVWSGVLFGLGYLMRYSVLVPAAVSGFWLVFRIKEMPHRKRLKRLLLYSAGFLAVTSLQTVPNLIYMGRPFPANLLKMIWGMYEMERTGTSFSILFLSPDAPPSTIAWVTWFKSQMPLILQYWSGNLLAYLLRSGFRITGPVWFPFVYPAIVLFLLRAPRDLRRVRVYVVLIGLSVVLYHSLLMFVGRYVLLVIPLAITFAVMLFASGLRWLDSQLNKWQVNRQLTRAATLAVVLLVVLANLFAEFRVIYMPEKDNYLYSVVDSALRASDMDSATQVGTVFLTCGNVYYDLGSPLKTPFQEILILPSASVSDLHAAMVAEGKTYVIIDQCSESLQPELNSVLLNPDAPIPGFEEVLLYPKAAPTLAIYRLSGP